MRILIVTGASGGHIFPAIGFLEALKDKYKDIEALLVVPKRCLEFNVLAQSYRVKTLSTTPISLRLNLKNVIALFNFIRGSVESLGILLAFKPDSVVGFGSLDSIPLVLMAWMARIKTLVHEQNYLPGRANRLLARFCDKIAISFAETQQFLKVNKEKLTLTGNPIRKSLQRIDRNKASDYFGFQERKFTILVTGGSRGSHRINSCFLEAVCGLPEDLAFQVIHIAGIEDYPVLENGYRRLNWHVKLFPFLKEMQYAYSMADLVICRAGATTIAELIYFKIPAIIIPYPFAYRHQLYNAKMLQEHKCAILIRDEELEAEGLRRALRELSSVPEKTRQMREGYCKIPEYRSGDLLAELAVSLN